MWRRRIENRKRNARKSRFSGSTSRLLRGAVTVPLGHIRTDGEPDITAEGCSCVRSHSFVDSLANTSDVVCA